jgi:hypothetical protein
MNYKGKISQQLSDLISSVLTGDEIDNAAIVNQYSASSGKALVYRNSKVNDRNRCVVDTMMKMAIKKANEQGKSLQRFYDELNK